MPFLHVFNKNAHGLHFLMKWLLEPLVGNSSLPRKWVSCLSGKFNKASTCGAAISKEFESALPQLLPSSPATHAVAPPATIVVASVQSSTALRLHGAFAMASTLVETGQKSLVSSWSASVFGTT